MNCAASSLAMLAERLRDVPLDPRTGGSGIRVQYPLPSSHISLVARNQFGHANRGVGTNAAARSVLDASTGRASRAQGGCRRRHPVPTWLQPIPVITRSIHHEEPILGLAYSVGRQDFARLGKGACSALISLTLTSHGTPACRWSREPQSDVPYS